MIGNIINSNSSIIFFPLHIFVLEMARASTFANYFRARSDPWPVV